MKAGDISIDLTINDKDFSVKLKDGGRMLSQFTRQLDTSARSAKVVENHFSSLSTRFRHFMIMVASTRFALLDINQVFLSLPRAILQTSGEIERMTKLLEGLSTAVDKTQDALNAKNFIFQTALNAPFEVKALTDAFVKLKTGGIDPMNGSMKAVVDSVAKFGGTSDHLHRASIAIQQMAGKGVISMEELRQQLGEAVPNAMALMAEGTAMSMAELAKTVSKGTVEANGALARMFIAMRVQNDGAAAAMMTTWTGMIERLKTRWELLKLDMGGNGQQGGMFDSAKDQLQTILDGLDSDVVRQVMLDVGFVFVEVSKGAVAAAESIAKFYNEIKATGLVILQLFAGYKLFTLLRNIEKGADKMYTTIIERNRAAGDAFVKVEREKHEKAVAEAQKGMARAERELARHQQRMQAMESRQTRMNSQAASLLQDAAAMERQARAIDQRTEAGRFQARQLGLEAAAQRQAAAARSQAATALVAERNALMAQVPALQAAVAHHQRLAGAQFSVASGARAIAATRAVMSTFWTAMGGWIGIATAALTVGVMKLVEWAGAAEAAAERAENAWRGLSSLENQKKAQEDLKKIEERIVSDSNIIANARKNPSMMTDTKQIEARLNSNLAARERLQKEVDQHIAVNERNAQERYSRQVIETSKREIAKQTKGFVEAQSYWNRWKDGEMEALRNSGATGKAFEKAEDEINKQHASMMKSVTSGRLDAEVRMWTQEKTRLYDAMSLAPTQADKDKYQKGIDEIEKIIADREQFKSGLDIYATNTRILGGGDKDGKGKGKQNELEAWLERVQEKLASINGELNKKGSGDIMKMMADFDQLDQKYFKSKEDRERQRQEKLKELLNAEDVLTFQNAFSSLDNSVGSSLEGIEEQLNGGSGAVAKMRLELAKLYMMDGANFSALDELGKKVDDFEKKTSQLKLRDLTMSMSQAVEGMRAGMSGDRASSAYADWTKDVERYQKAIQDAKLSTEDMKKAQEEFAAYVTVRYAQLQEDLKTPIQKLGDEWANTAKQMEQATVDVANRSMDALEEFFTTGKIDAAAFAEDILKSFLRIQMNTMYGGVVQNASEAFTKFMSGVIGGGAPNGDQAANAAASGLEQVTESTGIVSKAMEMLANTSIGQTATAFLESIGITKVKTATESAQVVALNSLTASAQAAAAALATVAGSAGGSGSGGQLLQLAGSMAMGYFSGGASTAATGGTAIGTGYGQLGSGTSFMSGAALFANGGIMTEFGAVALRKYANGGVANRPQLALFGEGSRPEAYVPLPDGRTIPVTMEGGPMTTQAGNVTVNVINNANGTEAKTSQSQDGQGNLTIDVIVDQIEGKMSQNIARGRSPVGQVLERQYGLNRANGAMR